MSQEKNKFPKVSGANLLRQPKTFPQDLSADFNLLLIAFYQPQQLDINTWLPYAEDLERASNNFHYFELPVIRNMNPVAKWFINEGMRAGIGDPKALSRTITLYLDKSTFRNQLNIKNEKEIQILLVDCDGTILWHTTGCFTPEKGAQLAQILKTKNSVEVT